MVYYTISVVILTNNLYIFEINGYVDLNALKRLGFLDNCLYGLLHFQCKD